MLRQSFHVIRRNSWKPLQQQSCFSIGSQNSDYSLYQYPMAKEPPKITTTTAAEALAKSSYATISPKSSSRNDAYDPFDDTNSLSDFERESIRSMQKKHLRLIPPGASPIGQKAPSHIPPNAPSESLEVPETKVTTLDNGIRVVSQETYSQMCVVGVLANFGSRQEHQLGTAHLSELLAFQSTVRYPDTFLLQDNMRKWGASSFAHSGREQTLWCLDLLRPNVSLGMELLQQATLQPQFLQSEVEMCKQAMTFQMMDALPEVILGEALQTAAFGIDQSLGKNHLGMYIGGTC
jgi:Insulinase (Peptidase family M16)